VARGLDVAVVYGDDGCAIHYEKSEEVGWSLVRHYAVLPAVFAPEPDSKPTNPKDMIGIRKAPLSCVPLGVVAELGVAMLEGAAKYGRHNYRGVGVRASVYFDATIRHLFKWWEGEDIDADSSMHHVTKALASLAVLRDAQMQGKCSDDRPPASVEFYARLDAAAADLLARHAGKTPHHWTQSNPDEKPLPHGPGVSL
jgi:hypothetical protein